MAIDLAMHYLRTCRDGDGTPHVECEWCGGCVHGCRTDINHMEHFLKFARPGEPECGEMGATTRYLLERDGLKACQLPAGHADPIHETRDGSAIWPIRGLYDLDKPPRRRTR